MVENFSSGYYIAQLQITPHSGERAIVQTDLFSEYLTPASDVRPLVVKVDNYHIPVYEETSVPSEVLALPEETYCSLDLKEDLLTSVFLAKEKTVDRLIKMSLVDLNGL